MPTRPYKRWGYGRMAWRLFCFGFALGLIGVNALTLPLGIAIWIGLDYATYG